MTSLRSLPCLALLALLVASSATAAPLAEAADVRARPDASAPVLARLNAGAEPVVAPGVTAPAGWLAVELPGPIEGFVANADMTKQLDVKPGAAIRAEARADATIVATGEKGEVARITGLRGRWTQVSIDRKRVGYVRQQLADLAAMATAPAVAAPLVETGPGRPVPSEARPTAAPATLARSFPGKFVSTRRPLAPRRPYDFQLLDETGERFAYVDVSRLTPAETMDKYVDRTVIVTGMTRYSPEAQSLVIEADNLVVK